MAGPCANRSPCQNSFPTGKDEPAGAVFTEGGSTPTPTPAPVVTPAVIPNLDNELFKQFIKAYFEAQTPTQIVAKIDVESCEHPLKARLPDLYYGDLHIECYRFCQ